MFLEGSRTEELREAEYSLKSFAVLAHKVYRSQITMIRTNNGSGILASNFNSILRALLYSVGFDSAATQPHSICLSNLRSPVLLRRAMIEGVSCVIFGDKNHGR